jgi:hypothetical protein
MRSAAITEFEKYFVVEKLHPSCKGGEGEVDGSR